MKVAFKTYESVPIEKRPASIPLEWPANVAHILDEAQAEFEAAGFTVLSQASFDQYRSERQTAFDAWANAFDQNAQDQEIRVNALVDDKFITLPQSKIDFRLHLKPNIYLQKNVIMLPNGRPQKALYSYNNELIAEIEFTFEVNAFNFMVRRIEKLAYYKKNGTISEQWVIADDIYDQNNTYHLREMMKERSGARSSIIEEVKAFLNGVLAQYYLPQGKTYPEILQIAGDFWTAYGNPIDSWINVGSPQFQNMLTADVQFSFLEAEIAAGVTVRSYILNKTSY